MDILLRVLLTVSQEVAIFAMTGTPLVGLVCGTAAQALNKVIEFRNKKL